MRFFDSSEFQDDIYCFLAFSRWNRGTFRVSQMRVSGHLKVFTDANLYNLSISSIEICWESYGGVTEGVNKTWPFTLGFVVSDQLFFSDSFFGVKLGDKRGQFQLKQWFQVAYHLHGSTPFPLGKNSVEKSFQLTWRQPPKPSQPNQTARIIWWRPAQSIQSK